MELQKDFYVGTVEDNKDPNRKGRIKVRVLTLYHNLAIEDIPYAYPFAGLAGKEFQVPAIGKLVNILFLSDDLYSPYYIYSENYNVNLQNKLKSLSDEEYANFSALLFDESTQIFIKGQEITIDQLLNKITINNNSINHELKDNTQILNLGSRGANQDAVLGTNFFKWMDRFIAELGKQQSMFDSNGSPILKTKLEVLCKEYKTLRPKFVSNNVKIVDNGDVRILSRTPETINNKNDVDLILDMKDQADQCQDYKEQESQELNNLYKAIQEQNDKACETLNYAAPTKDKPIRNIGDQEEELKNKKGKRGKRNQKFIDDLHPAIVPYVIRLINTIESELGVGVTITSGYRSIEDQQKLINSGNRDAAQPGRSYHQYGLAVDIWPEYNGKLITKATQNNFPYWREFGNIGKSLGFRWGNSFKENWHFDMGFDFTTNELYRKYVNNDLIAGGFVNLDSRGSTPTNTFNGQEYSNLSTTAANSPCSSNFNSGGAKESLNPNSRLSDESEGPTADTNLTCNEQKAKILLDEISKGEANLKIAMDEEKVDSLYDISFAYGKYTPKTLPNGKPVQPISSLTIGEVKEVQRLMLANGAGTTAIGKYQFKNSTLSEAAAKANLSDNMLFSPENQDKLAIQKLVDRGYNDWISGKKSDDEFQFQLAKEWASIALPNKNISYHKYQGKPQPVNTTDDEIKQAFEKIRNSEC